MRTPGPLRLPLVLALLLLAGCGGGGSTESTSVQTGTLTKAQFLRKANAICVQGSEEFGKGDEAFWRRHGGPGTSSSQALTNELQLTVGLPFREKELRRIRALGLPRGDEQRVEAILEAWQEGVEKGEEDPSSLDAGGPEFAFYKAYSMGIDYGLEKCWLG